MTFENILEKKLLSHKSLEIYLLQNLKIRYHLLLKNNLENKEMFYFCRLHFNFVMYL